MRRSPLRHIPIAAHVSIRGQSRFNHRQRAEFPPLLPRARNDRRYFTNEALKPGPNGPVRGCTHGGCSNTKLDPEGCRERGETGFLPVPPPLPPSRFPPKGHSVQRCSRPSSLQAPTPSHQQQTPPLRCRSSLSLHPCTIQPTPPPPRPPGSCFKPCVIVLSPRVTMNTKPMSTPSVR